MRDTAREHTQAVEPLRALDLLLEPASLGLEAVRRTHVANARDAYRLAVQRPRHDDGERGHQLSCGVDGGDIDEADPVLADHLLRRRHVRRRHELEHRAADELGGRAPEDPFGGAARVENDAVSAEDRQVERPVGEVAKPGLALAQERVRAFTLRDVADSADTHGPLANMSLLREHL